MKRLLALFLMIFWMIACQQGREMGQQEHVLPPDSIISEAQMILLLTDIHIIEAALLIKKNKGEFHDSLTRFYYQGVFKKFRISAQRFQANMDYYQQDPQAFAKLYERVVEELTIREKNHVVSPPR